MRVVVWLLGCLTLWQLSGAVLGHVSDVWDVEVDEQLYGSSPNSRKLLQSKQDQSLWDATAEGDGEGVKKAIKKGADVEVVLGPEGVTPLFVASEMGHLEVVKGLLDAGANVSAARASDGARPLFVASEFGHAEIVTLLLEAGADPELGRTSDDTPPLVVAPVTLGISSEVVVRSLIDEGANLTRANALGLTGLYSSAYWGNVGTLRIFLQGGADPKVKDAEGNQPRDVICRCTSHDEDALQCGDGGCDNPRVLEDIAKMLLVFNATAKGEVPFEPNDGEKTNTKCDAASEATPFDCILGVGAGTQGRR